MDNLPRWSGVFFILAGIALFRYWYLNRQQLAKDADDKMNQLNLDALAGCNQSLGNVWLFGMILSLIVFGFLILVGVGR